jgi:pimeloyl-ACP methyl ester carboxylesterase
MAVFKFEGREIYYEDHGGDDKPPLLLLNGIFMSCASWAAFVPTFSAANRLLLLDFPDQGKSAHMSGEYNQDLPVNVTAALLNHLGLPAADIVGISYGGEVAMQFAARFPGRVRKLVLSNTAAYTSEWLRDTGNAWEYACQSHDGHQFFKTCIPVIYSPGFYQRNYAWISAREDLFVRVFTPAVYDAFARLIRSAENHDQLGALGGITAPTLVISAEYDFVTPIYQQKELAAAIPGAGHVLVQDSGHAVMYEKPAEFTALVLGFVNADIDVRIK